MSDIAPVKIKVVVDASNATQTFTAVTQGLDQMKARTSKIGAAFSNLKTTMLGVLGGNLLTNAVMMVGQELNAMKQETIDLQQQTIRLNQALSGIGITSTKVQKEVYTTADSFYQLGFQGSEAISAMGTLVTATGDVTQATKLMAMAADLARYKHIDMESASKILARGTQGSAKAFKELGITLDTTIPKNQAISKAFDELNKKIGGQAKAYTTSFAGQMAVLKERMDNLFQSIASKVLPILAAFIGYITANGKALLIMAGIIVGTLGVIKTYTTVMAISTVVMRAYAVASYQVAIGSGVLKIALQALFNVMKANPIGAFVTIVMLLGTAFTYAWNHFEIFRKGIVHGLQIIINAFGYFIGYYSTVLKLLSHAPGMGFLKGISEQLDKGAKSVREYGNSLDKLIDKKTTKNNINIPGVVKPGDPTGIKGNIVGGDAKIGGSKGGGGGDKTVVQNVVVYASNTNDISKNISKLAKNGMPIGAK